MFTKNVKAGKRGRPPGQSAQGAAARERLYKTAIRVLSERGYEATTLREISADELLREALFSDVSEEQRGADK